MNLIAPVLRAGIRIIDAILRRVYGVWEFTDDADCILRISIAHCPGDFTLSDGTLLHRGDPVVILHLWNERIQQIEPTGPSLAWARWMRTVMRRSLQLLASYTAGEPRLRNVVAFGGITSIFTSQALGRPDDLLAKWGVDWLPLEPPATPLQRFGNFLDRMYAWWLMWAFNPGTLRSKTFAKFGRCQIWISRRTLLERYGPSATEQQAAIRELAVPR